MCSHGDRMRAAGPCIEYDLGSADAVRELGCPKAKKPVRSWYGECLIGQETGVRHDGCRKAQKHSPEERQAAADYCSEHGRSITRAAKETGCPCRRALQKWVGGPAPGRREQSVRSESTQFTQGQEMAAAAAPESRSAPASGAAAGLGTGREGPCDWRRQLPGAGARATMKDIDSRRPPDDPEGLEREIREREACPCRLNLETATREQAARSIKRPRYRSGDARRQGKGGPDRCIEGGVSSEGPAWEAPDTRGQLFLPARGPVCS